MADRYITQKVFSMAWPYWDEITGKPDLSPSHVNALLRNERAALEYAANMLLSKDEEEFDVEQPMDDLIEAAFNDMNQDALKLLNKVFKYVTEEFYTLEFIHPGRKFPVFRAYAYPVLALKLIALYTVYVNEIARDISMEVTAKEFQAVQEGLAKAAESHSGQPETVTPDPVEKINCCTVMPPDFNIPICSCAADGENRCKYWFAPDTEGCMCLYQIANEEAQGADDLVACVCEEAVSELEQRLAQEDAEQARVAEEAAKAAAAAKTGAKRGRKPKASK